MKDPLIEFWQNYFETIAIPERTNLRRQKNRVSLKVRSFMVEFINDFKV